MTVLRIDPETSLASDDDNATESGSINSHSLRPEQCEQLRERRPSGDLVDLRRMQGQPSIVSGVTLTLSDVERGAVVGDRASQDTSCDDGTNDVLSGCERNLARNQVQPNNRYRHSKRNKKPLRHRSSDNANTYRHTLDEEHNMSRQTRQLMRTRSTELPLVQIVARATPLKHLKLSPDVRRIHEHVLIQQEMCRTEDDFLNLYKAVDSFRRLAFQQDNQTIEVLMILNKIGIDTRTRGRRCDPDLVLVSCDDAQQILRKMLQKVPTEASSQQLQVELNYQYRIVYGGLKRFKEANVKLEELEYDAQQSKSSVDLVKTYYHRGSLSAQQIENISSEQTRDQSSEGSRRRI